MIIIQNIQFKFRSWLFVASKFGKPRPRNLGDHISNNIGDHNKRMEL